MASPAVSDRDLGLIPLLLGVTGHRDLRPEDLEPLRRAVRQVVAEFRTAYPHTPLVLLTPLAEGADQLVAEVVLAEGGRIVVPLPMPLALYETDFQEPEARQRFYDLLAQAESSFELPLPAGVTAEAVAAYGPPRNDLYLQVGRFIAEHCQVLIALWDGVNTQKTGGTWEIVSWRVNEVARGAANSLHPPDPVRCGPVFHIVTPRQSAPPPEKPYTSRCIFPEVPEHERSADQSYVQMLQSVDRFNAMASQLTEPLHAQMRASANYLLPDAETTLLPRALQAMRQRFAAADALAVHCQRWTWNSLTMVIGLVLAAVVAYEITSQLLHREAWGLLVYPSLLGVTYVYYLWFRHHDFQNKYQDYRALAEGLRIQFFWKLAGLGESVEQSYLREQRTELDWIRSGIRTAWTLAGGAMTAPAAAVSSAQRLEWVKRYWVEDQNRYFARAAHREERRHHFLERVATVLLSFGLGLAVVLGLLLVVPIGPGPAIHQWFMKNDTVKSVFFLATGLPLAAAAAIHTYGEVRAMEAHARQYRAMGWMYANALKRLEELQQSSSSQDEHAEAFRLLTELGREALLENGDWVLLHRARPVSVPHGR